MNCRTFERNLEDYLQDGLDFSGRFGMERHARQCIRCGKQLAGAQRLSEMTLELNRVKAPPDFESSVLNEIGKRKYHDIFSFVRRFWVYGIEWPSWRKLALTAISSIAIGFGAFSLYRQTVPDKAPAPSRVSSEPATVERKNDPVIKAAPVMLKPSIIAEALKAAAAIKPSRPTREVILPDLESSDLENSDTEYAEYLIAGPDNRPMTVRLPKKIRMQYGQASEEYFIRNVSH